MKVRLQTASNSAGAGAPKGLAQTAVVLVRKEGFRALYRGLTASLGRQGTYSTTRFAGTVIPLDRECVCVYWEAIESVVWLYINTRTHTHTLARTLAHSRASFFISLSPSLSPSLSTSLSRPLSLCFSHTTRLSLLATNKVYDFLKAEFTKRKAGGELTTAERFATAMGAGGCGGIVGTPMDVCNVRMQDDGRLPAAQRRNYKHVGDAVVRIAREEGVGKLYSGLGPNVIRAMLMTAGQLATYDSFKHFLLTSTGGMFTDNMLTHFTASTLAGGVATLLTQPVDVVKTRVMAAQPGTYASALACAVTTLKTEGPLAFFKGTVPAFTRLGPQTILTFVFLEQLRRLHAYLTGQRKQV